MADLDNTLKLLKQQSVTPGALLALSNLNVIDVVTGQTWYIGDGSTMIGSLVSVFSDYGDLCNDLCNAIRYAIPANFVGKTIAILAISVIDCYNLQLHFVESAFKLPEHHYTGFEDCRLSRPPILKPGNIYYALVVEARVVDGFLRVLL